MSTRQRITSIYKSLKEKGFKKISVDDIIQYSLFSKGGTITDKKAIIEVLQEIEMKEFYKLNHLCNVANNRYETCKSISSTQTDKNSSTHKTLQP